MDNPTIRNWELAKHLILQKWGRLDAILLERTHGNFDEIVSLLRIAYDEDEENVIQELNNLVQQVK